jgi:hypothetical protein
MQAQAGADMYICVWQDFANAAIGSDAASAGRPVSIAITAVKAKMRRILSP